MAFVTARWLFDRDVAAQVPVQKGPVTFVLIRGDDGFRRPWSSATVKVSRKESPESASSGLPRKQTWTLSPEACFFPEMY